MNIPEAAIVATIIIVLVAILLSTIVGVLHKTRSCVKILQANHAARTLQFTDLSTAEWEMINRELGHAIGSPTISTTAPPP
ncbi:hypothetical protein LCGC14_1743220 [marine sediment metagenome]|uniref:Uncharacterized protein n=1 Tax=marine sediment metagenome TaxID=412755 RepID=A0A0F9H637_9ZZZZ